MLLLIIEIAKDFKVKKPVVASFYHLKSKDDKASKLEEEFEVKKGKTLAILGKTGSGKSTLLTLISRLYDTTSGTVSMSRKRMLLRFIFSIICK